MIERLTEPLHLNLLSLLVAVFGTTRAKIAFDLLVRQQHAWGLLHAADAAKQFGAPRVTAIELGVGSGTGLLNLCELAERIKAATGIEFCIVGFDTGEGMPKPKDYRDHPELYKEGWFPMDQEALCSKLPPFARLIVGDVRETIPEFLATSALSSAPLAFATIDVDYYSSTIPALRLFAGPAASYFSSVPIYVDDISHETHNPYCGELLAIREFNERELLRKISFDHFLVHGRVFKHAEWLTHMYRLHVLDHPLRCDLHPSGAIKELPNPYLKRKG